jgi:phospholipase C
MAQWMGHDQVIDDTNPANVDRTGNSTTLADGQLVPDYGQLRSRMPIIVVSSTARLGVQHGKAKGCP